MRIQELLTYFFEELTECGQGGAGAYLYGRPGAILHILHHEVAIAFEKYDRKRCVLSIVCGGWVKGHDAYMPVSGDSFALFVGWCSRAG
jgi:hypothetical protein